MFSFLFQKSNTIEFYSLDTLCHFVKVKVQTVPHSVYARLAKAAGYFPVDNFDGIKLTDYLHGKTDKVPDNVKNVSFRELNPYLFNSQNENRDLRINARQDQPVCEPNPVNPSFAFLQRNENEGGPFQHQNVLNSDNFNYESNYSQQQMSSTGQSYFPQTIDYRHSQTIRIGENPEYFQPSQIPNPFQPGERVEPGLPITLSDDRSTPMSLSSNNSSVVEVEVAPSEPKGIWENVSTVSNSDLRLRLESKRTFRECSK